MNKSCSRKLICSLLILCVCVVTVMLQTACNSEGVEEVQQRPNILFVYADDHAYQAIGAYGSRINETPNIDRLAREGMLFENAFVTNSICGPMRATVLTGLYSHLHGMMVNENEFDGTQTSFPELLQQAGYETAVIGKWHLGEHMAPHGFDYSDVLIGQGPYYNPPMLLDEDGSGQQERIDRTGYTTDIITDLTLEWLSQKRDPNKPFMLMYQHKAPHREWAPGPDYLTLYDDRDIPEPPTLFDDYEGRATPAKTQDMMIAESMTRQDLKLDPPPYLNEEQLEEWNAAYGPRNEAFEEANLSGDELVRWKYQRYVKDYLRTIASVDENLGRVLDYLDETGLAENTIVIYTSDQGFYLGEHGWFDKRWMYEESLRTPLIVRWPGVIEEGARNDEIVSPLDFAPTFLEITEAEIPEEMQGSSLLPLFRGETPDDWREYLYYHYYEYPGWHFVRRHYGVTDGRYKLIHYYEPDVDEWELFDVEVDPNELNSVYGHSDYAQIQAQLEEELARLRNELQVPEEDPPGSYMRNPPERVRPLPPEFRD